VLPDKYVIIKKEQGEQDSDD